MTEDKSVIDFPMDGAPSEGCSTTTILAQLSIEPDAGAGAVHTITFIRFPFRARGHCHVASGLATGGNLVANGGIRIVYPRPTPMLRSRSGAWPECFCSICN